MKKKKSLLVLGLLALVLVLGVGYAVVSEVGLDIGGTATVGDAVLKVSFQKVDVTKPDDVSVTNTLTDGALADTFTITDMKLNDTVTLKYTVQNKETDVDATLAEKIALSNSNEEYFNVSYTIDNASVPASDVTTVTVVVTLKKTPVVSANGSARISVKLEATADNNAD